MVLQVGGGGLERGLKRLGLGRAGVELGKRQRAVKAKGSLPKSEN